ncbi:MAG: PL29 family lyase N-terminal domain-containing protein [Alistipes sp.]|nr:PL29 family lyase N-terminal domain-containing protein [Alistipes sp.]
MKKLFICLSVISVLLASCSKDYDDSALWDSVNGLENRVAKLEELCKQMNTNISSLQEIVKALKERESITNVSTLSDGSGYSITFTSGKTITIYHGKNGSDGTNGVTPTISVKQDGDGVYYWTVNGNWLIVDGKKVKAIGTDGADGSDGNDGTDGTDGKDGITPKFKIDGGYWYISYDNEQSWNQLGKATGDSGLNGENGDAFFKEVSIADGFVVFILNDKESTKIKIPFYSETELTVHISEPGTLETLVSEQEQRTTISLSIDGDINDQDISFIKYYMSALEHIDLSKANLQIIPNNAFSNKEKLRTIKLPDICQTIGESAFAQCYCLLNVELNSVTSIAKNAFLDCYNLRKIYAPNLEKVGQCAFQSCKKIKKFYAPVLNIVENAAFTSAHIEYFTIEKPWIQGHTTGNIDTLALNKDITAVIYDESKPYDTLCANMDIQCIYIPKEIRNLSGAIFYGSTTRHIVFEEGSLLRTLKSYRYHFYNTAGGWYEWYGTFGNCPNLKEITLPIGVEELDYAMFQDCSSLSKVSIPKNSKLSIIRGTSGKYVYGAFRNCPQLSEISFQIQIPPSCDNYAFGVSSSCKIYVPKGCGDSYATALKWNRQNIIEVEE